MQLGYDYQYPHKLAAIWQFARALTRIGRKRSVKTLMIKALCDRLSKKPGLYLNKIAVFL